jgi:hypothetical protein
LSPKEPEPTKSKPTKSKPAGVKDEKFVYIDEDDDGEEEE